MKTKSMRIVAIHEIQTTDGKTNGITVHKPGAEFELPESEAQHLVRIGAAALIGKAEVVAEEEPEDTEEADPVEEVVAAEESEDADDADPADEAPAKKATKKSLKKVLG